MLPNAVGGDLASLEGMRPSDRCGDIRVFGCLSLPYQARGL